MLFIRKYVFKLLFGIYYLHSVPIYKFIVKACLCRIGLPTEVSVLI